MSGSDNPYNGSFGNQMSGAAHYGAAPADGSYIKETTTANFARDVIEDSRNQPVLVDFWAPWCGPCKAIAPVLDQLAEELGDNVKIAKVNVDEETNQDLTARHGVQNIPTLLFFKNGAQVDKVIGSRPKADLLATIKKHS